MLQGTDVSDFLSSPLQVSALVDLDASMVFCAGTYTVVVTGKAFDNHSIQDPSSGCPDPNLMTSSYMALVWSAGTRLVRYKP